MEGPRLRGLTRFCVSEIELVRLSCPALGKRSTPRVSRPASPSRTGGMPFRCGSRQGSQPKCGTAVAVPPESATEW